MRKLILIRSEPPLSKGAPTTAEWPEFVANNLQIRSRLPRHLLHATDPASRTVGQAIARRARQVPRFRNPDKRPKRSRDLPTLKSQQMLPADHPEFRGELSALLWGAVLQLISNMLSEEMCIGVIVCDAQTIDRLHNALTQLLRNSEWIDQVWYTTLLLQNDARGALLPSISRR